MGSTITNDSFAFSRKLSVGDENVLEVASQGRGFSLCPLKLNAEGHGTSLLVTKLGPAMKGVYCHLQIKTGNPISPFQLSMTSVVL